jgi:Cu+-exporting ATPase
VEEALRATAGVESARVDLMAHRASVIFDPAQAAPEQLVEAIRAAGYDAVLPRADSSAAPAEDRAEALKSAQRKAWVTLAAGALAMLFSMPLGRPPGAAMSGADHLSPDYLLMRVFPWLYALPASGVRWTLLAMTAAVVAWAGRGIYASALRALRHGATNMNTLVSLGTAAAFAYSAYATVAPAESRAVYFDAVLLILGFLLLGKSLEGRAKRRALSALDSLSRLRPATARWVLDGIETIVPLEKVKPGDHIVVLPGERFPVDATIVEGRTTVDESMLTGEPTPLSRAVGGRVLAGSLNYDGAVVCRADSLGEETVVAQIARMAEQAQSSRAPMERLADAASAIFVPVVLGLAAITFVAWLVAAHSFEFALANTVAVLVVACPCAMGLAVPAALTVAVGRGAQLGVLFKGGEALERLVALDAIVLDKTGTLTVGRPVLERVQSAENREQGTEEQGAREQGSEGARELDPRECELLRLAAAAEERSNHPLAHALVDSASGLGLTWEPAQDVQVYPGRGLAARVEGRNCLLGNEALFTEFAIPLPREVAPPQPGATRLWMALEGAAAAHFDARDALRDDAADAVASLRRMGLRVLMLTGDSAAAAAPIARQAGIEEVEAGLDPAGKLEKIRTLQKSGLRVAMVGDGINDAAALAQADAGLAMGAGADLAQEAGDVLLVRARPSAIPAAIALARQTLRIMRQNLAWAAGYNLVGIPLAAGVFYPSFHILLSPWLAAAAMAMSSVCVLGNSLRLRGWNFVG